MPVSQIAAPIALAVLRVAVVVVVGFLLARWGVLRTAALADLSGLVIRAAAPSLIFVNAANGFTGLSPASSLSALAASPALLGVGFLAGLALCRLASVKPEHRRAVIAASTFQNSAYLPIAVASSVLPSLARSFPPGAATAPGVIAANGLVTISLFGVLYSPLFWGLGLWWITESNSGGPQKRTAWISRLFPPAVFGVLLGYLAALTPLHPPPNAARSSSALRFSGRGRRRQPDDPAGEPYSGGDALPFFREPCRRTERRTLCGRGEAGVDACPYSSAPVGVPRLVAG